MYKLTIDQGNTRTKVALFNHDTIVKRLDSPTIPSIETLAKTAHQIILSSVKQESELQSILKSQDIMLQWDTPLPIRVSYDKPQTIGHDRLAVAVGAHTLFPQKNVLCIDMGTCITYDFVSADNQFLGGGISPGMEMRYQSLNHYTSQLPLLKMDSIRLPLIGRSTHQCIHSGVINGLLAEIDGIIQRYMIEFPNLQVVITGGDAQFFDKELKNTIFASPDLLMIGLNKILDYNETIS